MPLRRGSSKATIAYNFHELTRHGTRKRSRRQIIAIVMSMARKTGRKRRTHRI